MKFGRNSLIAMAVLSLSIFQTSISYAQWHGGMGYQNGHEYVDLDLPSGTLWATCNVGATTPVGYGAHFPWGETTAMNICSFDSYKYIVGVYDHYITKYCTDAKVGFKKIADNLTILEPCDDAATVHWGNGWRMPTKEEWEELIANTSRSCTTRNGVNGVQFSAPNGQTLFLPAAGYHSWSTERDFIGEEGRYWSSSLSYSGTFYAYGYDFSFVHVDECGVVSPRRTECYSVRPVCSRRYSNTNRELLNSYEAEMASINDVRAGLKDYKEHNRVTRMLIQRGDWVYFVSEKGEVITMDISTMDNDHDQVLRIQGEWCYHSNEGAYSWNFIDAQILSFEKVSVWIKYKDKKWEEIYSGPSTIYLSPNTVYSEKLSKAFPIPSDKSIYLGGIDDIRIRFEGGKVNTIYK